jgi:glutamyl-tRNA reductase
MAADEAQAIARWLRVRAASPSISGLRQQGHAIRAAELQRAAPRLSGLTPEQFSTVDQLTEAIVNKLLHGPTVAIREAAADSLGYGTSRRVLDVLRLDRRRA